MLKNIIGKDVKHFSDYNNNPKEGLKRWQVILGGIIIVATMTTAVVGFIS